MSVTHVENIIIGAGLIGSITSWILARRGQSGVLLDRSPDPGGVNGSFRDALGNLFDYGRHVINADRSAFTTDFFHRVQGGAVRRFTLRRGIVLRGHLLPYASPLAEWSGALRTRIELDPSAKPVRLGSTREDFAHAYGRWFADLAFDEMLSAFPTLCWLRARGVPEERLMRWIFPWFFPLSVVEADPDPDQEQGVYSQESRDYHYRTRHSSPPREDVLYPKTNGFGNWVECMLEQARTTMDICLGLGSVTFDWDPDTLSVRSITADGVRYTADRVFWCAPLPVLCRELGWKLPAGHPQNELLGCFAFRDPIRTGYHEILFADPAHLVRRVNFPGRIAGEKAPRTVQVEYTVPKGEHELAEDDWRDRWLDSLVSLGVVSADNGLRNFELRQVARGIVTTEDLGGFAAECRKRIAESGTNLITPHLAAASDNNSRLVPQVFHCVNAALPGT